jgi:hypothetical protein
MMSMSVGRRAEHLRPARRPGSGAVLSPHGKEVLMPAQLRLYNELESVEDYATMAPTVRVRLADLLPLVALAQRQKNIWLLDFLDDEVAVTPDLYDVLQAFRSCQSSA